MTLFQRPKVKIFGPDNGVGGPISAIFVINLDRQKKRWRKFIRSAKKQKLKGKNSLYQYCERSAAVDGTQICSDDISFPEIKKKYTLAAQYQINQDPRLEQVKEKDKVVIDMSSTEIAIAQSHLNLWKRIVEQKISYALILEDDVSFHKKFADYSNRVWQELPRLGQNCSRFDLLYLGYVVSYGAIESQIYSQSLFKPIRNIWSTMGYVLSFEGAQKLLDELPICGPVDLWLNLQLNNLKAFATLSPLILPNDNFKSGNTYSIISVLKKLEREEL